MDEREKGPVEILCKEIEFRFERAMERDDILVAFVRTLVGAVAETHHIATVCAEMVPNDAPSKDSGEVLSRVEKMLSLNDYDAMRENCAEIHNFIHEVAPDDAYPCDHLIDMLSSCVSAIRFGLEKPCRSRHAAEAAKHVWDQRYGVKLFDEYVGAWKHDWARAQLQKAIFGMVPRP